MRKFLFSTVFFLQGLLSSAFLFSTLSARELGVATMFRNEAPYLKEWIEYHRMAGVEHFWLYNDNSTDNWKEVLQPYIQEGLVEVFHWPVSSRAEYVHTQCRAFRDAMKKAIGNTSWIALIDIDEFILPLKEKTIQECLKKHFSDADAVYVNWRNFGTGNVSVPIDIPFLLKLTSCSFKSHPKNCSGKSIVRPEKVSIDDVWYPHHFTMKSDAKYVNGDTELMEFTGTDMKTDAQHHDTFIRINHYILRDENFYQNRRLAAAKQGYGDGGLPLLLEHYEMFSKVKDFAMVDFIKKKHHEKYEKYWKLYE